MKSIEGLYLTSFDAKRVRINKRVQEFYEKLDEYEPPINAVSLERENELMPEAYAEEVQLPVAVEIPIAVAIPMSEDGEFDLTRFRMEN